MPDQPVECPECHRTVPLDPAGFCRRHRARVGFAGRCPGSGRWPITAGSWIPAPAPTVTRVAAPDQRRRTPRRVRANTRRRGMPTPVRVVRRCPACMVAVKVAPDGTTLPRHHEPGNRNPTQWCEMSGREPSEWAALPGAWLVVLARHAGELMEIEELNR